MSRDAWFSSVRQGGPLGPGTDVATILKAFHHTPLAGRTNDPEAADYDEAAEIFSQGVRLARNGDLEAGCAQIAAAFLLDGRSINLCFQEPQDPRVRMACVDLELLYTLGAQGGMSYGSHVLRLLIGEKIGDDPREGQNLLAAAMASVNYLLQRVTEDPKLGAHHSQGGVLGGCMTKTNLLYHRSTIYMAMGNHRKAISDLTKALEYDPTYHPARDARASLWASIKLKDDKTIFEEYKRLVGEVHPDHRGLEVAYGWLGHLVLKDAKLGTLADAKQYYEKCLRASMRRAELYGPHKSGTDPPAVQLLKNQYKMMINNPEVKQMREQCDNAVATGIKEEIAIPEGFKKVPKDTETNPQFSAHACLNCGKSGADINDKLKKCARCHKVSYCSVECQRVDWKKHKVFCSTAKMKPSDFASPLADNTEPEPAKKPSSAAKEPIDELESGYWQCRRMIGELQLLWDKHGQGFANWWKGMKQKQVLRTLKDLTHSTLPKSFKYTTEQHLLHARQLLEKQQMSGCCIGIDFEYFLGFCDCQDPTQHFCNDKVLHLLHVWTKETAAAEQEELQFCKSMGDARLFPKIIDEECFIMPPVEENESLQVLMLSPDAPADYRQKIQGYVASGLVSDVSTLTYAVTRKGRILGLLVKLFDQYQEQFRRQPSKNPWERLHGCEYCHRGCEVDDEATNCKTCFVTWWCCQGCRKASPHGKKCPNGRPMGSAVLFRGF